ncbi:unnamed protein product [Litomosoides sigmodontis]|uniref:BRO1 domain-containing protein n=1 Tax=Litomosoides sigmodontis TaxID=42156 RepID=A0A3P6U940_LITSI|nr:unnamed protein product [Litomosoides sigmodontis]
MLTPDFKFCLAPLPASFSTQIKEYILLHYQDDPMKYDSAICEIENMRSKLSRLLPDSETLSLLKRYYAQLCLMKNRFPMEKGGAVNVAFPWMDKSSDTSNASVFEDINYELVCVMYNIGALHGTIAANEPRTDLDSIKNAFTHFQCAAYPFEQIRDSMNAVKYSAVDFDPSVLTFYVNILLAQAQECLLEKSIIDHRKNTVIAKIAIHLRDVYMQCREHLDFTGLNDILSSKYKEWLRTCVVKSEMYEAIAMLHLGLQAEDDDKMGFRVSYFDCALEHVTAAMKQMEKDKRESLKEAVIFLNDIIVGKQQYAMKENYFVYHDRVPKPEELAVVEVRYVVQGVNMVKAVGFDPTDKSISGPDLFAALLPGNVLKSLSVYSEEKAKFKRVLLEEIEEKNKELEDYIKSLQLEEISFNDESEIVELPEMLLERSAAFHSQPDAFPELLDKLHRVGDCAIEADHKISNLCNRLDSVNSLQLRADEGFIAIMKELNRVNDHHMKARTNNAELQRALAAHSESLKILAMPLNELRKRLTDTRTKPADSAEGLLLRKMLDKANEMSTQRCALISKLNEDLLNDDITAKCLAEKNEDNCELYENELKKHEGIATLIHMNLAAQHNILNSLTDANANFGDYRKKIIDENKRQVLALTAAYDVYVDVSQKTEEGLKFYSTLFSLVKGLEEAVEAIETAFEEEKKEKEMKMLRSLEERATSGTKWTVKNDDEPILLGPTSIKNRSIPEVGHSGLRLKDCLNYYRNNIARGTTVCFPHSTQQSPTVDVSSMARRDVTPQQGISTTDTVQFSESAPLRCHFALESNHSLPNLPLNSSAKATQYPYMFSNNMTEPPHSLQAVEPLSSQSQVMMPLVPQHSGTPPYHFLSNQRTSTFQNQDVNVSNMQQVAAPPLSITLPHNSQPISAAVIADSDRGPVMTTAKNVATPVATLSISTPLNYTPDVSCASNLALLEQSALNGRLVAGLTTTTMTEIGKPSGGAILNPKNYASPFTPNKMHANFNRNMVPTNTISTLSKPIVVPAHLIYSHDTAFQAAASPWHQPLRNVNDASGLAVVDNTRAVCASATAAGFQLFVPDNQATSVGSTSVVDIMNAPLDASLPTPLTPTHLSNEFESNNSSVQMVTDRPELFTESTKKEEINSVQMSECSGSSVVSSAVLQTPRPAAAVAPIMQTDCHTTAVYDSTLCITSVTSMSYSAPISQPKTTFLHTCLYTKNENSVGNEEERNSSMKEITDPKTFNIGSTDPVRLEKRCMREQFKTEGIGAQLPPLDPADPINRIDAHYWLKKS